MSAERYSPEPVRSVKDRGIVIFFIFGILLSVGVIRWFGETSDQIGNEVLLAEAQSPQKDNPTTSLPDSAFLLSSDKFDTALYLSGAVSGQRVILVGDRGVILVSADGGEQFQQVPVPSRRMICDVTLSSDGTAFAVGHEGLVLRSRDFGDTWEKVHHDPEADQALFSVVDLGNEHVVAAGAFGLVMVTRDGGKSWSKGEANEEGPHLYSLKVTGDEVLAAGEFGSILSSKDGGETWSALESPYEGTLFDILVTEDRWTLMGLRGNLWEGRPGEWTQVDHPSEATLFGGGVLADGTTVVVGAEGVVLIRSARSGEWSQMKPKQDRRRLLSKPLLLPTGRVLGLGEKGFDSLETTPDTDSSTEQGGPR
ncbi:MAG: hypothetical protein GWP39_00695 [Planctomycetia bacterium]|nr:hypothetical protein [Planctomycetia bacterium]